MRKPHVPTRPNCGLDGSAWAIFGNAAGEPRRAPALDTRAHRLRHQHRVLRLRHRGVEQHRRAAELHRQRGVGRRADAGIEHDRHRRARADQLDQMRVRDAKARPDQRTERHHRGSAGIGELAAHHRVFGAVRQHDEALRHQRFRRLDQFVGVGIEQLAIADHLDLDPVGAERLARQLGGEDRVLARSGSRRCWAGNGCSSGSGRPGFRRRRRG